MSSGPHAPPLRGSLPPEGAEPLWGGPAAALAPQDIQSRDNPLVKELRALAQDNTAYRQRGRVWLDGDHLCRALLSRGQRPAIAVFSASGWLRADAELARAAPRVVRLPDAIMASVSGLESPPAMGFVVDLPDARDLQPEAPTVVLDRLRQIHQQRALVRVQAAGLVINHEQGAHHVRVDPDRHASVEAHPVVPGHQGVFGVVRVQ